MVVHQNPCMVRRGTGQQTPEQTRFSTCAAGLQQCSALGVCSSSSGLRTKRSRVCCGVGALRGFGASAGLKWVSHPCGSPGGASPDRSPRIASSPRIVTVQESLGADGLARSGRCSARLRSCWDAEVVGGVTRAEKLAGRLGLWARSRGVAGATRRLNAARLVTLCQTCPNLLTWKS